MEVKAHSRSVVYATLRFIVPAETLPESEPVQMMHAPAAIFGASPFPTKDWFGPVRVSPCRQSQTAPGHRPQTSSMHRIQVAAIKTKPYFSFQSTDSIDLSFPQSTGFSVGMPKLEKLNQAARIYCGCRIRSQSERNHHPGAGDIEIFIGTAVLDGIYFVDIQCISGKQVTGVPGHFNILVEQVFDKSIDFKAQFV